MQSCTSPPQGGASSKTAQAGLEGLGGIRQCVGRSWKFNCTRPTKSWKPNRTQHPDGASLSSKRSRQDRRDSGVSALCGRSGKNLGGVRGRRIDDGPHVPERCRARRRRRNGRGPGERAAAAVPTAVPPLALRRCEQRHYKFHASEDVHQHRHSSDEQREATLLVSALERYEFRPPGRVAREKSLEAVPVEGDRVSCV